MLKCVDFTKISFVRFDLEVEQVIETLKLERQTKPHYIEGNGLPIHNLVVVAV